MAKYIKSVRIRRNFANGFDTKTELDIRVAIYDRAFSKRSVLGVDPNKKEEPDKLNKIWPEVEYSGSRYKDLTDDEVITDYIRTQSKLNSIEYAIIQDPWSPEPPILRNFGFDPYYLNNGTELYVKWFKFDDPSWTEVSGTYESGKTGSIPNVIDIKRSEPISGGTVSANSGDRYLVGKNPTGPNWSKYGNTMPIVEWNSFGQFWSETFLEDGITVYVDLEEVQYKYSSGSPVIVTGGTEWSDKKGNERDITSSDYLIELKGGTPSNPKSQIIKKVETINQKSGEMLMLSIDNTIVKYGGSASREVPSGIPDIDIVNRFIDDWKRIVPNYDLKLCNPSNQKCELIEYISPIQPLPGPSVEPTGGSPSGASPSGLTVSKQKLTIVFPEDFKVMAREDVPKFSIWIGEPQSEESVDGFDFGPDSPFVIDEEYVEEPFVGSEEDFQVSECQFYESESDQKQTEEQAAKFNDASSNSVGANGQLNDEKMKESYTNYVPGKHKLDLIPGELVANGKSKIKCCAVPLEWYSGKSNVKPINVVIAPALIDMLTAAKEAGHSIVISSGFRPAFGPNLSAKTESGLSVSAESQEVLYAKNCPGGVCGKTETAKPGSSRHGNGIAVDLNTGTRDPNNVVQFGKLRNDVYKWLVKNSWKFGFVRAVKSEEWHWEYYGEAAIKGGPYYKIGKGGGSAFKKGESNFYSDLGVNNLQSPNYT